MNLLAIDPGKNTGWARFEKGSLFSAGKGDPRKEVVSHTLDLVLIEVPRWYPRERGIDTNDLLDLSLLAGRYAGHYEMDLVPIELVYPRSWKGTLDWRICCERVIEELTPEEVAVLPRRPRKKDVDHNVLDAVGLGLWKLGRFGT